ncbi:YqzL family protein [Polycladomyces sp. WAk]|uniref:YqzL family protein n=1 Tax=Polycladomyces zharkentensis TaxID=2807616 RepID=A0ABS2WG75_9BACL|nr:YqzL family protein [Polycladomyces sp. WAk]MBN2908532.1 YqzL family protein [Polycladomyces sp. WAk]
MREFFWNCFAVTGSVDAYLLYKDAEALANDSAEETPDDRDEEEIT